jgi:peptidoglycan/LPS O-acetylase OafA/YrhL
MRMADGNGGNGLGAAAGRVADHARRLVSLELELARAELKRKVGTMALGIGLAAGAAVFGLLGIVLLVATVAAALTLVLPVWAAVLVVAAAALLLAGGLGMAGLAALKRGAPPVPEQAIEEARLTSEALKSDGR